MEEGKVEELGLEVQTHREFSVVRPIGRREKAQGHVRAPVERRLARDPPHCERVAGYPILEAQHGDAVPVARAGVGAQLGVEVWEGEGEARGGARDGVGGGVGAAVAGELGGDEARGGGNAWGEGRGGDRGQSSH